MALSPSKVLVLPVSSGLQPKKESACAVLSSLSSYCWIPSWDPREPPYLPALQPASSDQAFGLHLPELARARALFLPDRLLWREVSPLLPGFPCLCPLAV